VGVKRLVPYRVRRRLKISRAHAFEALGSERYSRPALYGLDVSLSERLPSAGTFLEIGAADGYSQSNTYYLERFRGWRGILIEAVPSQARICKTVRPNAFCVNAVCVAVRGAGPARVLDQNLMSVVVDRPVSGLPARVMSSREPLKIPTTTLSEVIDSSPFGKVDLITIDVEGAELDVLAGLDFKRHRPRWLLVETNQIELVRDMCEPWGLTVSEQLTHHDYLLVSNDSPITER
jgi:FkbM family methyltransferase